MEQQMFNQDAWLQLGLGGAALFVLLIFVFMYMRNSSKNIDNLCQKIDRLVDSTGDSIKILSTTVTQWNIEQKNNIQHLEQIAKYTANTDSKLDVLQGKIDALLSIKSSKNRK